MTGGQAGYDYVFFGLPTNSGSHVQSIDEYGKYLVSAKHASCPNGLKGKSNILTVRPKVNPMIEMISALEYRPNNIGVYDTVSNVIGCTGDIVSLAVDAVDYSSVEWYVQNYLGDDDYVRGAFFDDKDTVSQALDAKWVTVVVDSAGCIGESVPLLLDGWAFQLPAISSSNNSELCELGDSTLLHLAFPGEWASFQWYVDGVAIPGAIDDSLYAKDLGEHTLSGFPEKCPHMELSSGQGPTVKLLYSEIWENDTVIFAMPELGYYSYQWYLNGDPIAPHDANLPWLLYKDQMEDGIYAVDVMNENCTKVSDDYVWTTLSAGDLDVAKKSSIFPNPTTGSCRLVVDSPDEVETIYVYNSVGLLMMQMNSYEENLDLSRFDSGLYFIKIYYTDDSNENVRVVKE